MLRVHVIYDTIYEDILRANDEDMPYVLHTPSPLNLPLITISSHAPDVPFMPFPCQLNRVFIRRILSIETLEASKGRAK